MHLLLGLQLRGCSKGLLCGSLWSGKCPLLPHDPGLAMTLRHTAGNCVTQRMVLPVFSYEPQICPAPPFPPTPSLGVETVLPNYPSGLSIIPGTGQGMTQHHGMCMMSSQTLPDNRPSQIRHMALYNGGWIPLGNSRSLVHYPQCF